MTLRSTTLKCACSAVLATILGAALAPDLFARQAGGDTGSDHRKRPLTQGPWTRIADPKLDGGQVSISYYLEPAVSRYDVQITVLSNGAPVCKVFQGREKGSTKVYRHVWDGKDKQGNFVDPGSYTVHIDATNVAVWSLDDPVDIVRLGLVNIGAVSSDPNATNEWQTVYYLKDGKYKFYATPSTGEFVSKADTGDVSDLDLNDGTPRPMPKIWKAVDAPITVPNGSGKNAYDTRYHDYPLCYLANAQPEFEVTFGANCTTSAGLAHDCNYPVAGYELRCVASDELGAWTTSATTDLHPGDTVEYVGPALPAASTRTERELHWSWQYRVTGAADWNEIPGQCVTRHRIYTILDVPSWTPGATGTQYSGPWVEVCEDFFAWQKLIGITPDTPEKVVEVFVKGFFGQNSGIPTAIEGVVYDCPSNGGDGGATHYYVWGNYVNLSRLLNQHDLGKFVNCSDCASLSSTMLGMIGIQNTQMLYLGSMTLRAIWGIGGAAYTTDLWSNGGGSGHGFSYHHVITRDGAVHISDDCLCVDEDGDPDHTPGLPGWNNDREWNNYESLLAKGNVSWTLDVLPGLK